ncbi:MAG: DMT family transporter [Candidatus Hodarchaeota archaeon]
MKFRSFESGNPLDPSHGFIWGLGAALLTTFLWSVSFVAIKIGLEQEEIRPLSFAALRYLVGFLLLGSIWFLKKHRSSKESNPVHSRKLLVLIAITGIAGYSLEPGLRYLGMAPEGGNLPALHSAFICNFNPTIVLLLGLAIFLVLPAPKQVLGLALALIGAYIYFMLMPGSGGEINTTEGWGIILTLGAGFAWGSYQLLTKHLTQKTDVFLQTTLGMGVGALFLFCIALLVEGWPTLSITLVALVMLLGIFSTALAYLLWNYAMRYLGSFEATMLQNSMLIQIAILSVLFLGQKIYLNMLLGILLVLFGVFLVQMEGLKRNASNRRQTGLNAVQESETAPNTKKHINYGKAP